MSSDITPEAYAEMLRRAAIRKFGEERARSLDPAIQEIAQTLARLAEQRMGFEEEPAFFN
jgi:hypothetical protein